MATTDDLHRSLLDLRRQATDRADRLRSELEDLTVSRRSESDDDEHDPEGVPLSSEWSRLNGLLEGAQAHLDEVEAALGRWEKGTYGICTGCGMAIPAGRLEARPFAEECVPCAEARGR